MLSSCDKNEGNDCTTNKAKETVTEVQSTLTRSEMLNVQKSLVGRFYGSHRRAEEMLSESDAQEMLTPLVEDGTAIVGQILEAAKVGQLEITTQEVLQLETMTGEQLAELSLVVYNLNDPFMMDGLFSYIQQEIDTNAIPISDMPGAYTKKELVDCLTVAFGLGSISGLYSYIDGTYTIMTANTAFQIARGFIGRTMGWIGLAYAAYEYGNCLHSKKKGNR